MFLSIAADEFGVGPSGNDDTGYTGPLYYAISLYYTMQTIFTIG